jgi:hypothetical protein
MSKTRLSRSLCISLLAGFCLTANSPLKATELQTVHLMRYAGLQKIAWYEQQAQLWQSETAKTPDLPQAWQNYYLATEYAYLDTTGTDEKRQQHLVSILQRMGQAVANSHEYVYLQSRQNGWQNPQQHLALLEEAHRRCPTCGDISAELAMAYEVAGQDQQTVALWETLYRSQTLAPGLLDYNYNMLMSADDGAIILTNGDNDTYPALMLQRVHAVRPDVLVLNLYLIRHNRKYLQKTLNEHGIHLDATALPMTQGEFTAALCQRIAALQSETPLHIALTVDNKTKERLNEDLYIVGLTSLYSPRGLDNLALLKRNIEQRFRLNTLEHNWYGEYHPSTTPVVRRLNANYAFPFALLAEHYRIAAQDAAAIRWQELALEVARQSGSAHLIKQLTERLGG